jgi:hypothetical protein
MALAANCTAFAGPFVASGEVFSGSEHEIRSPLDFEQIFYIVELGMEIPKCAPEPTGGLKHDNGLPVGKWSGIPTALKGRNHV